MKYCVLFICCIFLFQGTAEAKKLSIAVSIPPQKYFVNKIAQGNVTIEVLVPQGADPHTFEPKPRQLQFLRDADIYFSIGIGLESKWLTYGKEFSPNLHIIPSYIEKLTNEKILPIKSQAESLCSEKHDHNHEIDQHIWLSPMHVIVIVERMRDALIQYDSKNAQIYKKNSANFIDEIQILHKNITESLSRKEYRTFLSYHKAWDYFAREYNLEELAIEKGGKQVTAKDLATIMEEARLKKVNIAIGQPQHGMKMLELVARTLGITTRSIDPLSENWIYTMNEMQKVLVEFLY